MYSKVAPFPRVECTVILPPKPSTKDLTVANPIPVPLLPDLSRCVVVSNILKIRSWSFSSIPGPLSTILTLILSSVLVTLILTTV